MGKLSLQLKRTTTKGESGRKKENKIEDAEETGQPEFDPELQELDFRALYERIDPEIKEQDDALRKKEEVKWKIQNKYGGNKQAAKGGKSAAGRSPINE